eukprot:scaffold470_cov257-Pinguiococcus_pyrenoidosus.AAC.24
MSLIGSGPASGETFSVQHVQWAPMMGGEGGEKGCWQLRWLAVVVSANTEGSRSSRFGQREALGTTHRTWQRPPGRPRLPMPREAKERRQSDQGSCRPRKLQAQRFDRCLLGGSGRTLPAPGSPGQRAVETARQP